MPAITPEQKAAKVQYVMRRKEAARQFVLDYLDERCCEDCGEDDSVVLEFDHVRGIKRYAISIAVQRAYSIAWLAEEMAKCDVVCANCHRRRTSVRCGSYRVAA